ncbi:ABC transporter permease [Bosea sp. (in: a-proteobacteria)]|jgi:putative spermidine/putrescine transport system permease protein|uniref:ABC transporter permease n=1 Tax=Bosea sp. (in: a-proteobacteria) TaxID=1871050 RepID=UPI00086891D1|nr:ABC transporter permease [Bosea sp. (in: a-proteobacteria)]MBN9437247.1 ABC transporter permease [Bosea sp. (in: a-proteobacteria)]ODT55780.1 MAG: ABC transporter permease [Methylobacterium sp. SCN 67-24]
MSRNGTFAIAFHTVFVAFMLAPLVVVMWMSLTPSNLLSLPTTSFSLRWFWAILRHSQFIDAFWFSILLGVLSASLAMVLAVPAALALARYRFPGRDGFVALFLSPLIIPHVVLGVAFLRFFTQIGTTGTFIGLLGAHVLVIFPYGLRLVLAALTTSDPAIERAAISLGASQWTVFRRVLFPLMIPGVAGGWVISFIQSFDEVTMTVFVATPSSMTLPVRMYHYIEESIDPLVASVSTVVILLTFLLMAIVDRIYGLDRILVGKG